MKVSPPAPTSHPPPVAASARPPARRTADMDYLLSILLVLPCACAAPSSYGSLMRLRRDAYPVYSGELADEYEPYAVAVLPTRTSLPVLQLVSPASYGGKPRRPVRRPRPESDLYAYDTSQLDEEYEPYAEQAFEEAEPPPKRTKPRDQYEDEASSVIVYARPNKHGGFTYRRPSAPAARPRPAEREPVIIRIHKYRVIH